ncbi:SGNH/GDSL hydrolase family protein [Paenibacillus sacheonensis]|uniref:SGNH/GDSL hydrolase family protein n=1 Tax=Paenibacillus sacheonensis TaxID=742054 RepID=A0A7X5C3H4_9BACL|nr:SGNH/GDSL hydrolase family protein [Paenibacillus sacheonensis]MBM7568535.1 lysophospholipase L1-like esterase [Paenibacillus sacheonensis]NBC72360.1 SGNH/GDSL hydrolase family protein [Paenibacillus sacheonensis]
MAAAIESSYLNHITAALQQHWPSNRAVNIVCHGHSVPSGYFATPVVDAMNAYPHLLRAKLAERFPFAVMNVIVTAIGGEQSEQGAERFGSEVLTHRPDVLTIDYALNDRGLGLERAGAAWRSMIEAALAQGTKVILMTPTWESSYADPQSDAWRQLCAHRDQVVALAEEYGVGLMDSFGLFEDYAARGGQGSDLLSWVNHPNRKGHELVAEGLLRWFNYLNWRP